MKFLVITIDIGAPRRIPNDLKNLEKAEGNWENSSEDTVEVGMNIKGVVEISGVLKQ